MKETVLIECPHCNKSQIEDIYDLVDTGDQEGEFNINCNECKKEFKRRTVRKWSTWENI